MDGQTTSGGMFPRLAGMFYAMAYAADRARVLGITLGRWIRLITLALIGLAILQRRPAIDILALIALAILVRIAFGMAGRAGYVAFKADRRAAAPLTAGKGPSSVTVRVLAYEEKVHVTATGLFSIRDREDYVLLRPADYWRVANGDHAIMVEHRPGRFLYQFIQPGSLQGVEAGLLYFGRRRRKSLFLTYLTSWGPEFGGGGPVTTYGPSQNGSSDKLQRKAYLSFKDEETRQAVWRSLLQNAGQPVTRKL